MYRSRNKGQTWPVGGSRTFVATSVGTGLAWDSTRARLLVVGSKGDTYTLVPTDDLITSPYTQRQTLPSAPTTGTIHLRAGGTLHRLGLARRERHPLAASLLWRSDDGGETWAAVTPYRHRRHAHRRGLRRRRVGSDHHRGAVPVALG